MTTLMESRLEREIERLTAMLQNQREITQAWKAHTLEAQSQAAEMKQRIAELEKDAARYRTCVELCFSDSIGNDQFVGVMFPRPDGVFDSTDAMFIAAIDAAKEKMPDLSLEPETVEIMLHTFNGA